MKKSMLEKLTEFYETTQAMGNFGHAIGFYRENNEIVKGKYEFPNGTYTIEHVNGDFFCWGYKPI